MGICYSKQMPGFVVGELYVKNTIEMFPTIQKVRQHLERMNSTISPLSRFS